MNDTGQEGPTMHEGLKEPMNEGTNMEETSNEAVSKNTAISQGPVVKKNVKENPLKVKKEVAGNNKRAKLNKALLSYILLGAVGIFVLSASFSRGIVKPEQIATTANPVEYKPAFEAEIERSKREQVNNTPAQQTNTSSGNQEVKDVRPPEPPKPTVSTNPKPSNTSIATNTTAPANQQGKTNTATTGPIEPVRVRSEYEILVEQSNLKAMQAPLQTGVSSGAGKVEMRPSQYFSEGTSAQALQAQQVQSRASAYREWNDQAQKQQFAGTGTGNAAIARTPVAPSNTLYPGTIIPGVLITGINTDLPGAVLAMVTENVYDSVTGENILIPQGSRLIARYNSAVSWGQNRVQIAWETIIRPDGVSIDLNSAVGVDARGNAGSRAQVNEHWGQYAKGIGLLALVTMATGQLEYTAKTINPAGGEILQGTKEQLAKIGGQYVDNTMQVQPTLTIKQGTKIQVFVNQELYLPATPDSGKPTRYNLTGGNK